MSNYALVASGQLAVLATATQFPTIPANGNPFAGSVPGEPVTVILEALKANAASVFIGSAGVTDATGLELAPGAISPPLKVNNLNLLYAIAAATGNTISYLVTAT